MQRQDKEFFEAMITLTQYPEWDVLVKDLEAVIYHTQANALEAPSWDKVNEDKGFARGLAYIVNLRDNTKMQAKVLTDAPV